MRNPSIKSVTLILALILLASIILWNILPLQEHLTDADSGKGTTAAVPVEVAAIEHGPIQLLRTFTGTLAARSEFVAAPKVSGRLEQLHVDLADTVQRGQVVAELDDAEYVQEVARAQADLDVEQASHTEARSLLQITERELKRLELLRQRGNVSESQLDAARSELLARQAQLEVAAARIARAEAELEAARIRLGYTQVQAGWHGGSDQRLVAERYVDAGETVAANAPLLRIVELHPITAVFFITERDYARLQPGQQASLTTDAYAGEEFQGRIQRIAPVFSESTRQARVELQVENPDLRLKPGMFARATVMLQQVTQAVIVPAQALTRRDDRQGVFLLDAAATRVHWHAVEVGIRQADKVQVIGAQLSGRVVTLGQQLLDDGSRVVIVEDSARDAR